MIIGEPFCTLDEDQVAHFVGRAYDGGQFIHRACIPIQNLRQSDLHVRNFYKHSELTYSGGIWFIVLGITRLMVTYVEILALWRWIRQGFFNLRALKMLDCVPLLECVVSRARDKDSVRIEPMLLMSELFSDRWILHPDGLSNEQYL